MDLFKKNDSVFRLLSEAISEGIIVVNKDQIIIASNESLNESFGYAKDELTGNRLETIIPKKYHPSHGGHVSKFLKKGDRRRMGAGRNLYGKRKDDTEFPVEVGLNPFSFEGEGYVMALVIDISERKKAEQELQHWARIFNESLNEIYIFESNTLKFINVNEGALNNLGYSLEALRKLTPVDIKPEFDRAAFIEVIEPLLNKETPKIRFETIHERKDGTTYPVEVHLQLSSLESQSVFVAMILDITERKNYTLNLEKTVKERTLQLTEALAKEKDLNELKTRFLSLVSHEFKTPLSGILTSATLAGKYTQEDQQEKREKHLKTIQSKVKFLNNIINDFLSIERIESGKVNYKQSVFPLSKVINEVIYDANSLLKNGQKINYPSDIDEIELEFDEKILGLVLTNLINNAIKYSPENSMIDIGVLDRETQIEIEIKDHGIGIAEQEQKFVFNRYFRANNALHIQGTGIGLNIVKSHLENLGGTINFISQEGLGSTFNIYVPKTINKV